jgi:hypothetical protein
LEGRGFIMEEEIIVKYTTRKSIPGIVYLKVPFLARLVCLKKRTFDLIF